MERFFKRKLPCDSSGDSSRGNPSNNISQGSQPSSIPTPITIDLSDLPWDPADRPRILDYHPNQREEIRRMYWARGACQPRGHNFPTKTVGTKVRRFVVAWFDEFHWLEYSVKTDKAFCLCCYLFRDFIGHQGGSDTFVTKGFDSWSKKSSFKLHMGNVDSFHNKALQKCENLMRQNQSIVVALHKQTEAEKNEYRIRLLASISCCRFLLRNGLPFRGHNESEDSISRGLFFETLDLLRENNESIHGVTSKKAPKNHQLTSPKIQKDIIECFSLEILKSICEDIGTDVFALLVDESSDVSKKEQMAVVLRYVDKLGIVKESFVGVVHVTNTSSLTLKAAIDDLLTENRFSWNQVKVKSYLHHFLFLIESLINSKIFY